jgi:hypothetical protein
MAPIPSPASVGFSVAAALGADFDLFTPDVSKDPQHYDGLIREAAPVVYFSKYAIWATGRPARIEQMMRDWRGRIALSGPGAEPRTRKDLVQASYLGE